MSTMWMTWFDAFLCSTRVARAAFASMLLVGRALALALAPEPLPRPDEPESRARDAFDLGLGSTATSARAPAPGQWTALATAGSGFRSRPTIAARGIDVEGIRHGINHPLPNIPESYVHRIGRTARAGARGVALSFCDTSEIEFLRSIEALTENGSWWRAIGSACRRTCSTQGR